MGFPPDTTSSMARVQARVAKGGHGIPESKIRERFDRGRLNLDEPVRTYLPDLRLADERVAAAVTLRHLLTHRAGWVGDEFEESDFGQGDDALARAIATFGNRPQVMPLGSLWSYNNSGFWWIRRRNSTVSRDRPFAASSRSLDTAAGGLAATCMDQALCLHLLRIAL